MIDAKKLLTDLQAQQKKLEVDLREQIDNIASLKQALETEYKAARDAGRTSDTFTAWAEGEITQAAVAWLLACVFLRFCEDNGLIAEPSLAGPGDANRRAKEVAREYFRGHPTENDRHYLQHAFESLAQYPAVAGLYDPKHNPLFRLPVSADAAAALVEFWQRVNPDSGELVRDFTDSELDTRFLGDLYQDLSESARKRYALLQTPLFVEEFILDRTLDPAIETFGLEQVRMIDPTCGSGHFLLGGFARINALCEKQGVEPRERVKRALGAVYGVDLNPFAAAIARFRLLVAALKVTNIFTLKEAPGWKFNVTAGDSLLHGRRFGELDLGGDDISNRYGHCFFAEDREEIDRILGQQYHAVVGNPPYITVKDAALNMFYRRRYRSCHMKYSLGVPFTERFLQLAVSNGKQPAGYVGLITTNTFMKREFGKKLIEEYLPRQDLTHIIDMSDAHIPGHGTPTVILFARHRPPVGDTIRTVLSIRKESTRPVDPAQGSVWTSIVTLLDRTGGENEFVTVSDTQRAMMSKHPWSLSGGGIPDVMVQLAVAKHALLCDAVADIGFMAITGEDEAFLVPARIAERMGCPTRPFVVGDMVRDWATQMSSYVAFPYSWNGREFIPAGIKGGSRFDLRRWDLRTILRARSMFGKSVEEHGYRFDQYMQFIASRVAATRLISFAFVATHNHFVLDRGGKISKQSAPVIMLPTQADDSTHLGLLGLLNSSVACFWMKQVLHDKGGGGIGGGIASEEWEKFYEHTGTAIQKFPLPGSRPDLVAMTLDQLASSRAAVLPNVLAAQFPLSRSELSGAREQSKTLLMQMIGVQEELDWWCYRAYGLIDEDMLFGGAQPVIQLGERAFEIVMARKMAADELETTWFQRHGSTPITEVPTHWSADYRRLVQRRIELIESHPWIGLIEKPEYKRRWNQPSWEELEHAALQSWLLDRLESGSYWPVTTLQTIDSLIAHVERDADFMAVAALFEGQEGFALRPLLTMLLAEESVPALKVLRYKDSGLRKRADWEHTWELQRQEDAIDAEVAREMPREDGETEDEWEKRLKPEQSRRKREQVGDIAAPPKYTAADFVSNTIKRLRGDLDVPKERFFTLPKGDAPGESLYGWAGWNHVQRVQAIAGAYTDAESRQGWPVPQLVPLLAAVNEELPWVMQWHNQIDEELGVRLGDYFREWLGTELQKHRLTKEDLEQWQSVPTTRARMKRAKTSAMTNESEAG